VSTSPTAREPRSALPAALPAVLLALVLLAAGAALVRDALALSGLVGGRAWTTSLLQTLDGLTPQPWMLAVGVALALVGLVLVVVALAPRRRTEVALGAAGTTYARPGDLARLARARALDVDGVTEARSSASRTSLRVDLRTTASAPDDVRRAVEQVVGQAVSAAARAPRVRVRARSLKVEP
jgi:hypothetical protein